MRNAFSGSAVAIIPIALAALLAGCAVPVVEPDPEPSAAAIDHLVFISPAPSVLSWQIAARCFVEAAEAAGIETDVWGTPGANTATADQLRFIEQAVAEGADGIVGTSFTSDTAVEAAFQSARDAGILVATMASGSATEARNFDVGIDITKFGEDTVDEIASNDGQHKVALLVAGLTGTPKQFIDAFEARAAETDNVEVIQVVTDDGVVTKDADLINALLTAQPDVTDIVAVNPGSTAGVVTAIRERGKAGEVSFYGNSISDPAPASLEEGTATAFYVQKRCDLGTLAVEKMIALAAGDDVPRNIAVETKFVTVDDYAKLDRETWT